MKKKLEADLISIAHRVLQIKNKSDINQLCIETQKLYEKLMVLQFVEEHFEGVKPTIGQAEIVEKMKQFFEETHLSEIQPSKTQDKIIVEESLENEVVAPEMSIEETVEEIIEEEIVSSEDKKLKEIDFLSAFDIEKDADAKETEAPQVSLEELLGGDYKETLFVKVDESNEVNLPKKVNKTLDEIDVDQKSVSLNDKIGKGINIDLNDRIAFVKHLFGNSAEDYNRVLNQLITYDNFEEAQSFIDEMVKPDYNSWEGKEDYSQRFIGIIEKKFA